MKKYYYFLLFAILVVSSTDCQAQATGHAVDLGLSVMWSSCNVGASSPEATGGYYAWGETEEKDLYGNNYAYRSSDGSFVDIGNDISGTQYDVARVKWGGSWRMPTYNEGYELVNNCTWTWTSLNGVSGHQVTGPNGNSIFLPACGRKYGDKGLRDFGEYGCYWLSNIATSEGIEIAELLLFYEEKAILGDNRNRLNGCTIRPVTNIATGISNTIREANEKSPIYNINGQRLSAVQKGINIIGRKKVIAK